MKFVKFVYDDGKEETHKGSPCAPFPHNVRVDAAWNGKVGDAPARHIAFNDDGFRRDYIVIDDGETFEILD